jgi:citronellol/citronellal dehydrogenase
MSTLQGKTLFITGATRGIGKAIGLAAARDGANVVVAGKSSVPNPKLPGTIHSAAAEMEAAGGRALASILCPEGRGGLGGQVPYQKRNPGNPPKIYHQG